MNNIFVNYRHLDAQHAAIAVAETLRWTFADGEVFLDRTSVQGGAIWPDAIDEALNSAKVLVAIIGPGWLHASDQYGRRRIDHPDDWVRRELLHAFAKGKNVVPVLLDGAEIPPADALDVQLQPMLKYRAERVRVDSWDSDLSRLIETLKAKSDAKSRHNQNSLGSLPTPRPSPRQQNQQVLDTQEINRSIAPLGNWRIETNFHPWAVGGQATELVRHYEFASFADVVSFMASAASEISCWEPPHHPRWENQWRSLRVCFSTWDVGCNVTSLDVAAAEQLDKIFRKFTTSVGL